MRNTYGLPTFFAFYVFFVWDTDGRIQLHRDFIDQSSCEAIAKKFKEDHYIYWKKNEDDPYSSDNKEGSSKVEYPHDWKGKCIPASEWPF
jgi:hypothetical protein